MIKEFVKAITIINLIVITKFFKVIYISIFKYFLAIRSTKYKIFEPILTYNRMIEKSG